MTGSTTQATIDLVDLITGTDGSHAAQIKTRFGRLSLSILYFAAGCAVAAVLFWLIGFWCLGVPVLIGAATAAMAPASPKA